ncbi:hypothetical protein [Tepidibacillus fermentans]|nr:hypothetical protein [Tepidibacillus fermentans]
MIWIYKLLKELTQLHRPSGFEQPISYHVKEYIAKLTDSVEMDKLGNVIA